MAVTLVLPEQTRGLAALPRPRESSVTAQDIEQSLIETLVERDDGTPLYHMLVNIKV